MAWCLLAQRLYDPSCIRSVLQLLATSGRGSTLLKFNMESLKELRKRLRAYACVPSAVHKGPTQRSTLREKGLQVGRRVRGPILRGGYQGGENGIRDHRELTDTIFVQGYACARLTHFCDIVPVWPADRGSVCQSQLCCKSFAHQGCIQVRRHQGCIQCVHARESVCVRLCAW